MTGSIVNKLVVNAKAGNHLSLIQDLIKQSNKVWISVAFLKQSGLSELEHSIQEALKRETSFEIYCGVDLYITEPSALRQLYQLLKGNGKNKLRILESKNQVTFHPKIYCFHKPDGGVSVVIGSANLTNGGLCNNVELSILEGTTTSSDLYTQIKTFFAECDSIANEANELNISQYQRKYEIFRRKISKANKEAKKEISSLRPLKHSKFSTRSAEYRQDEGEQQDFAYRTEKYKKARKILDTILDTSISSEKEFLNFYEKLVGSEGQKALWHSGSLFRQKNQVANQYKLFIEMLRKVKANIGESPHTVFGIGLDYVKRVKGLGANVLTEIMNTYSPKEFAVLNSNPVTSLKYFGFTEFPPPGNFKPQNYVEYNELIREIMLLCHFDDMSQVDHFLNYIYWKYARKKLG